MLAKAVAILLALAVLAAAQNGSNNPESCEHVVEISRGCLNERLESNPNQPLIFSPADSTATCVKLFVNERDMSPCPNGGGEV